MHFYISQVMDDSDGQHGLASEAIGGEPQNNNQPDVTVVNIEPYLERNNQGK